MSRSKPVALVVDDEPALVELVGRVAASEGFDVVRCSGGREAIERTRSGSPDLVLVDLCMPDIGGLEVLRAVAGVESHPRVVLMTGHATIDSAVEAIKAGAADYLTKPFDLKRLHEMFALVRDERERRERVLAAERVVARTLEFHGMIGRSQSMRQVFDLIRRLAPHVRTVLITGETGTGKELVARAFHKLGSRAQRRFLTMNCSAVVETLFESELFGHVRGAFTGATDHKPGLFEAADGGSLFLDEVGELPATVQAKLLRVLESGEIHRVGSLESKTLDVRVIAATNRDLTAEVEAGRFRRDLFYRLNIAEIALPPLRTRTGDLPYLTAAFLRDCATRLGKPVAGLTPEAEEALERYDWPGNVRELRNVLERACIVAEGRLITTHDLIGLTRTNPTLSSTGPALTDCGPTSRSAPGAVRALNDAERDLIARALAANGGNKSDTARQLGLSRRALYRRLVKHGLDQGEAHNGSLPTNS